MKCDYCQDELSTTMRFSMVPLKSFCQTCKVTYRYNSGGQLNFRSWEVSYRGKQYRIQVRPDRTDEYGNPDRNFIVLYADIDAEKASRRDIKIGWEQVFSLDFVPDWTPQNTHQKLSTYLLFL